MTLTRIKTRTPVSKLLVKKVQFNSNFSTSTNLTLFKLTTSLYASIKKF